MALYPVELLEYTAEEGTQENPWDISAEGEGNNITAYLEKNNGDESTPTYTLVISGSGAMADFLTRVRLLGICIFLIKALKRRLLKSQSEKM